MRGPRLKPGSLTAQGAVVGIYPVNGNQFEEPVIVPADYGVSLRHTLGRCKQLEEAGWVMCPAALMPRIPNHNEAVLINKDSVRFRLWLRASPERRRAGAAR